MQYVIAYQYKKPSLTSMRVSGYRIFHECLKHFNVNYELY